MPCATGLSEGRGVTGRSADFGGAKMSCIVSGGWSEAQHRRASAAAMFAVF